MSPKPQSGLTSPVGVLAPVRRMLGLRLQRARVRWGMLDKELRRVRRDKAALQRALIVPASLVLPAAGLNLTSAGQSLFGSRQHLPALAFGFGATIGSVCLSSLLVAERKDVWLLFTFPRRFSSMLLQQAVIWVLVACGYTALVLGYGWTRQPLSPPLLGGVAYCFIGVTLISLLATAFAAHSVDAGTMKQGNLSLSSSPQVLITVAAAVAYSSGFYTGVWRQFSLIVLLTAVVVAAWREAERRLPYLLEPELRAQPTLHLLDGVVSALLYVVLQELGLPIVTSRLGLAGWRGHMSGFVASGALVSGGALLALRYRAVPQLLTQLGITWGAGRGRVLLAGMGWSLPACLAAVGFAVSARRVRVISEWPRAITELRSSFAEPNAHLAFLVLSLVAAPLFEELIFRGLIFRALRTDIGPRKSALLASLLFAVLHPGAAALSIFAMGVCAAGACERSRSLLSAVIVHAVYNATLLVVAST